MLLLRCVISTSLIRWYSVHDWYLVHGWYSVVHIHMKS